MQDVRRQAYARAGEAVARHTQGRPLGNLALDAPLPPVGRGPADTRAWQVDLGSRVRHQAELEILARWAGLLAESRACLDGRPPPEGWGPALEPLEALGRRVTRSDDENDAYLEWLRRRAWALVDLPEIWAAIEAVAEPLAAAGRLEAGKVDDLIAGTYRARRHRTGFLSILRRP